MRGEKQTRGGRDERIARLAESQHGVVSRMQLLDLGLEAGAIDRAIAAKRLHPLYRGVYAVGHRVLTQHSRWMAAVLATGPEAALSYRSAATLWGIRDNYGGQIHTTSPSKSRSHDLAAESPEAVEPALRQAEYLRRRDRLSLPHLLDRYPGHRGNRAIRTALARLRETPGRTRSRLEERFLGFIDRYDLLRPHFNAWLTVGAERFQADCLWPEQRLIVELDSWSAHGTRSAFRADKRRDRRLAVAGYRTTRIPWAALDDEPDAIAADLRQLLAEPESAQ